MSTKLAKYTYDDLGRLVGVEMPTGASVSYSFDAAGNRQTVLEVPGINPPLVPVVAELPREGGDFLNNLMMVKLASGKLVGWGDNTTGGLANSIAAATNIPLQDVVFDPTTTLPPFDATIQEWVLTNANLYVLFSNGWVYSAGKNAFGQLGHGDTVARAQLKRIEHFITNNITIEKIWAAGARYPTDGGGCVFFRDTNKVMYGCGINTAGNLGDGTTVNKTTPTACLGMPSSPHYIVDVVPFAPYTTFCTYMLTSDQKVLVAGNNTSGQLGQGNTTNVTGGFVNAKRNVGGSNVDIDNAVTISVTGGYYSTVQRCSALILDQNSEVWTCGYAGYGQLGLGNTTQQTIFQKVSALSNIIQAEIGGGAVGYAYAIDSAGSVYTWGYNGVNNTFRNNTTTPISTPSIPSALPPGAVSKIFFPRPNSLGANSQLFVLMSDGRLMYAGADNGQISITSSLTPGVKYVCLPREFLDGTETIGNIFVHGAGTTQRLFILSSSGNVYACGNNADGICTGGILGTTPAASVTAFKLDFAKFGDNA